MSKVIQSRRSSHRWRNNPRFRDLRQKYFKRYYYTWPSIHKFIALMNSKSPSVIKKYFKISNRGI